MDPDATSAPAQTSQPATPLTSTSGFLDMLPIALSNALLVILTFNVYLFWAKTNVRDYLWRTTVLDGTPMRYTGNGTVLARGFLVSAGLFTLAFGYPALIVVNALDIDPEALTLPELGLLPSLIVAAVLPALISAVTLVLIVAPEVETTPQSAAIAAGVLYLGIVLFIILSRFLTYRYLLRHTAWRGLSGSVAGTPWGYTLRMFVPELTTTLTLGWSAPWRFMRRFELLLDGATVCGARITFDGRSGPVYPHFAVTWVLTAGLTGVLSWISNSLDPENPMFPLQITLATLGFLLGIALAMTYYNAKLFAQVAKSIQVEGVELRFDARWWELAGLYFTNLAMNLLSVGVSYYYSRMRIARFIARHLTIQGSLPTRQAASGPGQPEPLAEGIEILAGTSYF